MHFITFSFSLSLLSLSSSLSFFSSFSFNIPTLARYNYQHIQLLDYEPLLFINQPRFYPPLPLRPRLCYILFSNGHNMYNENGARLGCTEAAQIERIGQPFSCDSPATGHYFCFRLYNIIYVI